MKESHSVRSCVPGSIQVRCRPLGLYKNCLYRSVVLLTRSLAAILSVTPVLVYPASRLLAHPSLSELGSLGYITLVSVSCFEHQRLQCTRLGFSL